MARTQATPSSHHQDSQLQALRSRKMQFKQVTPDNESLNTTRSGTPESHSSEDSKREFLIDVKPKTKVFKNPSERKAFVEQYKMKYKTEMCKNFELKGTCKFGDSCSFAHGKHELQEKKHLHEKFKTRPCKDFHQNGYCSYGKRCQYLHKEALGVNIFCNHAVDESLSEAEKNKRNYDLMEEIWRMSNSNIKVEKILAKIPEKRRLPVFAAMVASN